MIQPTNFKTNNKFKTNRQRELDKNTNEKAFQEVVKTEFFILSLEAHYDEWVQKQNMFKNRQWYSEPPLKKLL